MILEDSKVVRNKHFITKGPVVKKPKKDTVAANQFFRENYGDLLHTPAERHTDYQQLQNSQDSVCGKAQDLLKQKKRPVAAAVAKSATADGKLWGKECAVIRASVPKQVLVTESEEGIDEDVDKDV